jgi:hypothetical protein
MLKVLLARAIHDVPPTTVVLAAAMQAVPYFPAVLARWAIPRSPDGMTLPAVRALRVVLTLRVVLAPAVASWAILASPACMTLPVVQALPAVRALPIVPVVSALPVVGPPLEVGALRVAVQAARVGRAKGVVPPSLSGNRRPWIS